MTYCPVFLSVINFIKTYFNAKRNQNLTSCEFYFRFLIIFHFSFHKSSFTTGPPVVTLLVFIIIIVLLAYCLYKFKVRNPHHYSKYTTTTINNNSVAKPPMYVFFYFYLAVTLITKPWKKIHVWKYVFTGFYFQGFWRVHSSSPAAFWAEKRWLSEYGLNDVVSSIAPTFTFHSYFNHFHCFLIQKTNKTKKASF